MRLESLGFAEHVYKRLKHNGIETLEQLLTYSPKELRKLRLIGSRSVAQIERRLAELGYELPEKCAYCGAPSWEERCRALVLSIKLSPNEPAIGAIAFYRFAEARRKQVAELSECMLVPLIEEPPLGIIDFVLRPLPQEEWRND